MPQFVAEIGNDKNLNFIYLSNENCVDEMSTLKEIEKTGIELDEHGYSVYSRKFERIFFVSSVIKAEDIDPILIRQIEHINFE